MTEGICTHCREPMPHHGFCQRCLDTVGVDLVKKKFAGRTFSCSLGCGAVLNFLGACDPCIARKESAERGQPETLGHKLERFGVPRTMTDCRWEEWESFKRGSLDDMLRANKGITDLEHWTGKPALAILSGPSGTGKTHAAVATMARFVLGNGLSKSCRFWTEYSLAGAVKDSFEGGEDVLAKAMAVDLLVLDDFGSVRTTDWTATTVCGLLTKRIDDGLWTIITTNLDHKEINAIDERLASRTRQALQVSTAGLSDSRIQRPKPTTATSPKP